MVEQVDYYVLYLLNLFERQLKRIRVTELVAG